MRVRLDKAGFLGLALLGALARPLWAASDLVLTFPAPAEQTADSSETGAFALASGPFVDGKVAMVHGVGHLRQVAWRLAIARPSTESLMQVLQAQSVEAGYLPIYACSDQARGGFDFRFNIKTLSEPALHIDLGDFRYLLAQRQGDAGPEYISLLVSRSADAGFVQLTQAENIAPQPRKILSALAQALAAEKPLVLEDLDFAAGSAQLAAADYASLRDLAEWLQENPKRRVTLIGHTDATGSLSANIALSKQRAASVRAMLLSKYGLPAEQINFDGVGPAAPRGDEATAAGRALNRRVEVVVLPQG